MSSSSRSSCCSLPTQQQLSGRSLRSRRVMFQAVPLNYVSMSVVQQQCGGSSREHRNGKTKTRNVWFLLLPLPEAVHATAKWSIHFSPCSIFAITAAVRSIHILSVLHFCHHLCREKHPYFTCAPFLPSLLPCGAFIFSLRSIFAITAAATAPPPHCYCIAYIESWWSNGSCFLGN